MTKQIMSSNRDASWRVRMLESKGSSLSTHYEQQMSSDDQMEVDPVIPTVSKGKERAVENSIPYNDESLPWCVTILDLFPTASAHHYCTRVEKYRPVTLDDVVSHKDITTTSGLSVLLPYIMTIILAQLRTSFKKIDCLIFYFMAHLALEKHQLYWL